MPYGRDAQPGHQPRWREVWEHRPLKAFTGTLFALLMVATFFVSGVAPEGRTIALVLGGVFAGELVVHLRKRSQE